RFGRPNGVKYPLTRWNKVRNYVLGHQELGLPLDRVQEHFVTSGLLPAAEWDALLADPEHATPPQPPSSCGGCGNPPAAAETRTLEELFTEATSTPSDLNEHCEKLKELAAQCEHVTDFGSRPHVSTVALLAGQPQRLVSYAVDDRFAKVLVERQGQTTFEARRGDSLTVEIDETDLLFIDTKHTAGQFAAELERLSPQVRRWIVRHDTQIFGEQGEGGGPGLLPALRKFLREHPEWSVVYHTQANHGLTVISRDARDKPQLPSKITMATNFAKAVAAHVADGAQQADRETLEARLEVCTLCEHRNEDRCTVCGCYLAEKAAWRSSECPLGKWNEARETETNTHAA
ncbi:MAG: hypothetical protein KDA86_26965, partial [Planctomycetaceae bacterium]|nr:hypothetical protein [Planctomycetaceae bacterium]